MHFIYTAAAFTQGGKEHLAVKKFLQCVSVFYFKTLQYLKLHFLLRFIFLANR